jgi:hypothetical protein
MAVEMAVHQGLVESFSDPNHSVFGLLMPTTIRQNGGLSVPVSRIGSKTKDDPDLVEVDLDALDERPDDGPLGVPVDLIQVVSDGSGKVFEPADDGA